MKRKRVALITCLIISKNNHTATDWTNSLSHTFNSGSTPKKKVCVNPSKSFYEFGGPQVTNNFYSARDQVVNLMKSTTKKH